MNYAGKGVDIYILADGVEDDNREFGGRAFNVKFMPPYPYWKCTKYGTLIANVTAGNTAGVAKKSQVHVLRYMYTIIYCMINCYFSYSQCHR